MKAKYSDRSIVLWLIAALFVETLLLLWHLDIVSFGARGENGGAARLAGLISTSENDLRRRGANSLVWEKTATSENVYFYDSLLTLSQSTALLKLEHGTDVELAENTLVTIEPQTAASGGEIRLRFTRGSLQARNPFKATEIQAPEFTLAVGAGSDLQLRQVNEGEFEVRVEKGEATVESKNGKREKVDSSKILRMNHGEARTLSLDRSLKWVNAPERRIYVHADRARLPLRWNGPVRELVVQKTGAPERVLAVHGKGEELELELGHHQLYLRGEGGATGAPLDIEVWRAPTLHLISPLPRNRVRTEENAFFLWTRIPEASGYVFTMRGLASPLESSGPGNSYSTVFHDEYDANWSVWGVDKQGFRIPPAYEYPIYIRHEPLAAPKLKAPHLRAPASSRPGGERGASLWNWILPVASADEVEWFEAVFEWEPVSGANLYWVEISETPDFRNPVVSVKVANTEFVWNKATKRTYYWRVAAGGRGGRMGLFSEPSVLSGEQITKPVEAASAAAEPAVEKPVEIQPEAKPDEAKPAEAKPVVLHEPHTVRALWRGGYQMVKAVEREDVSANLGGNNAMAFALEGDAWVRGTRWWRLGLEYSSAKFTPVPKEDYPFQDDVELKTLRLSATRFDATSNWAFGFTALSLPKIHRTGFESIAAGDQQFAGTHIQVLRQIWHVEYRAEFSGLIGSKGYGFGTAHRALVKPWSSNGFLLGADLQANYIIDGSFNTLTGDAMFLLGCQW
jgi:hypothetical protein